MNPSERVGRMGRNALLNALRSVMGAAVAFATGVVIARQLGPADTGVYALVIWVAYATQIVFADGLAHAITKYVAQHDPRTEGPTIGGVVAFAIRTQLLLAAVGATVLVAASGVLADAFDTPDAQELFALAAILFVSHAFIVAFSAPLTGLERQGLLLPLRLTWVVAQLIAATIVLVVLDLGLNALILALLVVWPLVALLHFGVMARVVPLRNRVRISAGTRRSMIRTTVALTASSTLGLVVFTRSAVFMLGYFATTSEVAYYSIAYSVAESLQVALPISLAVAVMPNISRAFADADLDFARRVYQGQLRLTALLVTPVAIAGAVVSDEVIRLFYGDAFQDASGALSVLLFSMGLRSLGFCATWVLVGSDREKLVVWIYAGAVVISIGGGLALIPSFGVAGAVTAEAATQLFLAVAAVAVVWRTVGFAFPVNGFVRILLANVPVLALVALATHLSASDMWKLIFGLAVVVPAYVLGLWAASALSPFEKRYLVERLAWARGR